MCACACACVCVNMCVCGSVGIGDRQKAWGHINYAMTLIGVSLFWTAGAAGGALYGSIFNTDD